jgi:hypothetical protein
MAHSIQACRGKTELINDLDLLIIVGFALEVMRQSTDFEGIRGLAQEWQEALRQYGRYPEKRSPA